LLCAGRSSMKSARSRSARGSTATPWPTRTPPRATTTPRASWDWPGGPWASASVQKSTVS
jgi:hypothetical protein